MKPLGLIAGGGDLPLAIARRCEAEGRPVFVIRLAGFADAHLNRWPGADFGTRAPAVAPTIGSAMKAETESGPS